MVKKANELLESIAKLRTEPQKLGDLTAYGIGPRESDAPADYIKALQTAISAEKCKDSAMFKYAYNEQTPLLTRGQILQRKPSEIPISIAMP